MFILAHGVWQFIVSPLTQPKQRTGRYVRPGAASDVRCQRCLGKERGVHSDRCPDQGVYVDVLLCPDCGFTALLLAEYKNHVLQCHEAMNDDRHSRFSDAHTDRDRASHVPDTPQTRARVGRGNAP